MTLARRHLLAWAAALSGVAASARAADLGLRSGRADDEPSAAPASVSSSARALRGGIDAAEYGIKPGSDVDQSAALQRALDDTARRQAPLALGAGVYRAGNVRLPRGAQLIGVRGATRLLLGDGPFLIGAQGADHVTLAGLVLDGQKRALRDGQGLVHFDHASNIELSDCEIVNAGGTAVRCIGTSGQLSDNMVGSALGAAIHSLDARGLVIARNTVTSAEDNGILVWRNTIGEDGTQVVDNRIENIRNRSGGSGQYGNAINIFRAGNVIVRGNRIGACAFSGVRGNAASGMSVSANTIIGAREVAIYCEFGFNGAVIAGNTVDGGAIGISVTNFNEGGRLAVVQGNLVRNLLPQRPAGTDPRDGAGIGIYAEADTAISGNVVENAPHAALALGYGQYLRDVAATGNVLRRAEMGITVSVSAGAGRAVIANNVISEMRRGAIIAMDRRRLVGPVVPGTWANLTLTGNALR